MTWQRRSLVALLSSYIPNVVQRRYVVERLLDGQVELKEAGAREYQALLRSRLPGNVHPSLLRFFEKAMTEYVHTLNQKQDLTG